MIQIQCQLGAHWIYVGRENLDSHDQKGAVGEAIFLQVEPVIGPIP